ncbi:hypothetical protein Ddye_024066 [Dipteronia dyeriana]|uniref:Uncharacterized protein n=1 Tax=Dipteronia dyeriana TaxID=168575 RepID=A0AAD9WTU7_9ROSI|nr:hypothetical protein Ddye_024066 [Dipteronia dyeriana]
MPVSKTYNAPAMTVDPTNVRPLEFNALLEVEMVAEDTEKAIKRKIKVLPTFRDGCADPKKLPESLINVKLRSKLKDFLKTLEGDWFKGKLTRHDHFEALTRIDDALNRVLEDFVVEDWRRFMASVSSISCRCTGR